VVRVLDGRDDVSISLPHVAPGRYQHVALSPGSDPFFSCHNSIGLYNEQYLLTPRLAITAHVYTLETDQSLTYMDHGATVEVHSYLNQLGLPQSLVRRTRSSMYFTTLVFYRPSRLLVV
jgi:hypothetical protein